MNIRLSVNLINPFHSSLLLSSSLKNSNMILRSYLLVKKSLQFFHGFSLISSIAIPVLLLLTSITSAYGCYSSIISFGDSLTDTGNLLRIYPLDKPLQTRLPPYGRTFFRHPNGRSCDGRLIVDFIAESFGLPFPRPYMAAMDANTSNREFSKGVNFAVGGATALNISFLKEFGIVNPMSNVFLGTELDWFKEFFAIFCQKNPDCKSFIQSSLVLVGEIGGNDYNYGFLQGAPTELVESFVPIIIDRISSTIQELINYGARTLLVPGNVPIGCLPCYLTYYDNSEEKEYDPKTGCLNWLNEFSEYHNKLLQMELNRLRGLYPHVTIIYGDYYNAVMRLYLSPNKYGFTSTLRACCGAGGAYNYIASATCSEPLATCCLDPSQYISWDGVHLTEAAYRLVAQGLLEGSYTVPPLSSACTSTSSIRTIGVSEY